MLIKLGVLCRPPSHHYRSYTELQDEKEDVIDGLLRQIDDEGYDDGLSEVWVDFLDRWYAPLRFPAHGLQMLAAYVAQMAPASRVTNCAAFQAADELRRVQRIVYRTAHWLIIAPAWTLTHSVAGSRPTPTNPCVSSLSERGSPTTGARLSS